MMAGSAAEADLLDKERLRTRCDSSKSNPFKRNSLNLTRNDTIQPLVQSETDSSDEIDVFTTTRDGIIRFEEVAREPPHQTSLTLALGSLESTNKRKEKDTDPITGEIDGSSLRRHQPSGPRSLAMF
ncbi:hypothetical protein Rs2_35574 [Raphanus sativus]|nr:hypothetical protein Rs2_35574 [Raphanus sativus]